MNENNKREKLGKNRKEKNNNRKMDKVHFFNIIIKIIEMNIYDL